MDKPYDLRQEFERYIAGLIQSGFTIMTYEKWLEEQVLAARKDRDVYKAKLKNLQADMAVFLKPPKDKK